MPSMIFESDPVSPIADCVMLSIGFHDNGDIGFGAGGDPDELLARVRLLLRLLIETPSLVQEACGHRGVARDLFASYDPGDGE